VIHTYFGGEMVRSKN